MTKDDVIRMAREAGGVVADKHGSYGNFEANSAIFSQADLERFAALVAAHERAECLRTADDCADADMHASMAANAIRARGNA